MKERRKEISKGLLSSLVLAATAGASSSSMAVTTTHPALSQILLGGKNTVSVDDLIGNPGEGSCLVCGGYYQYDKDNGGGFYQYSQALDNRLPDTPGSSGTDELPPGLTPGGKPLPRPGLGGLTTDKLPPGSVPGGNPLTIPVPPGIRN